MAETWKVSGTYFEACNCETACPCVFLSPPTEGYCTVLVGWHIDEGRLGEVTLGGLNVALVAHSPGTMAQSKWKAALYLDRRATEAQKGVRAGREDRSRETLGVSGLWGAAAGVGRVDARRDAGSIVSARGWTRIRTLTKVVAQKSCGIFDGQGDLAKCLDRIDHSALLAKLQSPPSIRRQGRAWLRAGIMEADMFTPRKRRQDMALAEWTERTTDISATLGRSIRRDINILHVKFPQVHREHAAEGNHKLDGQSLNFLHEKLMTRQYQTSLVHRMEAIKADVSVIVID